jgi:hypothetical protein
VRWTDKSDVNGTDKYDARCGVRKLARGCPLRVDVDGIQLLTGCHEKPIPFGAAKTHISGDLGQADTAD